MNEEQKYLFDLQGYIVLKGVIKSDIVKKANEVLGRLEQTLPEAYPPPLCLGQPKTAENLYISNILEADEVFINFMDVPEILDIIAEVTAAPYRLNHTNSISRGGGGYTVMHMQGTPVHPRNRYRCHNGQIISTVTKAVFPLLDAGPEDGCFAVIPGSHKSNFPRPWGQHPEDNPPLVGVPANAGDAIVFTEALTHGSLVNVSGKLRRTLYYCYSIGYMPDWGVFRPDLGLRFSGELRQKLTEDQLEILRIK